MGVTRIQVKIDRLVLNGFDQLHGEALVEALRSELARVLADKTTRTEWAVSHRTPMLKLGGMSLGAETIGASKFGKQMATAMGRGLKP